MFSLKANISTFNNKKIAIENINEIVDTYKQSFKLRFIIGLLSQNCSFTAIYSMYEINLDIVKYPNKNN